MNSSAPTLGELLDGAEVIVTCGPGGVGKTTCAAALAVAAARRGRRVVVLTIDPARRLADALGITDVGNEPVRVPLPADGELRATMLDTASTFDGLIRTFAPSPANAEAILTNPLYRNLAGALSGTQEYMATERLHQLHSDPDVDLVVLDTPPSRHALDFLGAPDRLVRFLEHPIYRLLTTPSRSAVRAASAAARAFLWTVRRVAGAEVVEDAVAFFQAFAGMEEGFRTRAAEVSGLLTDARTGFVLVTSPRGQAASEAAYLGEQLAAHDHHLVGIVANLVHPAPPPLGEVAAPAGSALAELVELHAAQSRLAGDEAEVLSELADRLDGLALWRLESRATDICDLAGLSELAGLLDPPG